MGPQQAVPGILDGAELRHERGLTQEQLAVKLGTTFQWLAQIEAGRNVLALVEVARGRETSLVGNVIMAASGARTIPTSILMIWTMRAPIRDSSWPILGRVEVPAGLLVPTWFFKKDPISGKITIGRNGAEELEPEPGRAQTLERAAVWSASHVVDRLRDHFDGRPNKWVESLRLK